MYTDTHQATSNIALRLDFVSSVCASLLAELEPQGSCHLLSAGSLHTFHK